MLCRTKLAALAAMNILRLGSGLPTVTCCTTPRLVLTIHHLGSAQVPKCRGSGPAQHNQFANLALICLSLPASQHLRPVCIWNF